MAPVAVRRCGTWERCAGATTLGAVNGREGLRRCRAEHWSAQSKTERPCHSERDDEPARTRADEECHRDGEPRACHPSAHLPPHRHRHLWTAPGHPGTAPYATTRRHPTHHVLRTAGRRPTVRALEQVPLRTMIDRHVEHGGESSWFWIAANDDRFGEARPSGSGPATDRQRRNGGGPLPFSSADSLEDCCVVDIPRFRRQEL